MKAQMEKWVCIECNKIIILQMGMARVFKVEKLINHFDLVSRDLNQMIKDAIIDKQLTR